MGVGAHFKYYAMRKVNTIPGWECVQEFSTEKKAAAFCKGGDGHMVVWDQNGYDRWYDREVKPHYIKE